MTLSRAQLSRTASAVIFAALIVLVGLLALPGSALAADAARTVRYLGVRVKVPVGWPVYHLTAASRVCVRFNRHAVYLGRPGVNQNCPLNAIGRTEAILISPAGAGGGALASASVLAAAPSGGSMVRIARRRDHAVVTATWGRNPALIRRALGLRSLRSAMLASNGHRPRAARLAALRPARLPHQTSAAAPALPGQVYNGLGFDVCTTPSTAAMAAWGTSSPYGAIGVYIGGTNAACPWGNLSASWVSAESAAGWHLIPIYVGLQAPGGCCLAMSTAQTNGQFATAASQGTAAALDAVAQAQALGIGTGNPIYYDMENYTRNATNSGAVLAFLQAWTQQLHNSGYMSGVYSSGSSGITDLVANYGTSYLEPDELWTASWDSSSPATPPTSPANSWVPSTYWPGEHQLLQYYSDPSGSSESYGGVKINIDRDVLDAPTAAAGSGSFVSQIAPTPSLRVKPQPNGWVNLTPSWPNEPGITDYTILGGNSPTALTPIETISASGTFPVKLQDSYAYFAVSALNSLGEVVGTSTPVTTPPSAAIFGNSAYVAAHGPVGVPVACLNTYPCQMQGAIFAGKRRLAWVGTRSIPKEGGQLLFPLSVKVHRLIATAASHRVPVTVAVNDGTAKAARPLNLVPYTIYGKTPTHHLWPGSAIQIIGATSFVSYGWAGGVLAVCKSSTPCVATTRVTLGGATLAAPRTQTIGSGEIGYLTYRLNNRGHRLLRASRGNQLGARVTVTSSAPTSTGASGTAAATKTAMALISLVGFR